MGQQYAPARRHWVLWNRRAGGGGIEFSLSELEDLTVACARIVGWHPTFGHDFGYGGPHIAIIGMDTLLKFWAFGWELNPLRLYVVPYEEAEVRSNPIQGR